MYELMDFVAQFIPLIGASAVSLTAAAMICWFLYRGTKYVINKLFGSSAEGTIIFSDDREVLWLSDYEGGEFVTYDKRK